MTENTRSSLPLATFIVPVTLFLLSLLLAAPLWGPGLVNTRGGGDSPFLFFRLHQLVANLRAGVFPVRWMPDAAYGLGYPFFNHYAALPYYLAALPNLLGVDLLKSIQWVQTLGFLLAPLGLYGWAHRRTGRWAAWLAAVAYGAAPFHLVNVYVRGDSLSEFWAFVFYPLVLWAVDLCLERRDFASSIRLGLAYGGLVLTHNVSAMIFSPFVVLYGLLSLVTHEKQMTNDKRGDDHAPARHHEGRKYAAEAPTPTLPRIAGEGAKLPPCEAGGNRGGALGSIFRGGTTRWEQIVSLGVGLGLGLAVSAWFWLPALGETRYVQLDTVTAGYFSYAEHFRAGDLVQPSLAFDYAIEGRTPFAMGLVQAVLAGLGVILLVVGWIRRRRLGWWETFILIGLSVSTLMITPLSRPLWNHLPLLPFVQFPWRFLSIQALFAALAIGHLVDRTLRSPALHYASAAQRGASVTPYVLRSTFYALRFTVPLSLSALLTVASLWSLRPDRLHIAPDEVTVERLQLYEWFTENIGTTITYEYLPRWTVPRPYTGSALVYPDASPSVLPLSGRVEGKRLDQNPTRQNWQVSTGEDGATVAFPLLYWPGWQATVDGISVELRPAEDLGWAALDLPPGEHHVRLSLARTPLRILAENLSVIALVGLLVFVSYKMGRAAHHESRITNYVLFTLFLFVLSLSTLPLLWPTPHYSPDDPTWDFDHQPYLHHNPDGIEVGGVVASGYTVERMSLEGNLVYVVTLNWEGWQEGQTASVALVPPGAIRRPEVVPLAESEMAISTQTIHQLILPRDLPFGLLLLRLSVADQAVYLQPIKAIVYRRKSPPEFNYLCTSQSSNERDPMVLDLRFDWCAGRDFPLPGNYQINLRLRDSAGFEWANLDTQPGYGYLPTNLWTYWLDFSDYLNLSLTDAPPPGDYQLDVTLYRASTLEPVFQTTLPVQLTGVVQRPEPEHSLARMGDLLLVDLDAPQAVEQGAPLALTAHWWAAEATQPLSLTWSLSEGRGSPYGQTMSLLPLPQGGYVTTRPRLKLTASLSPGQYSLTISLGDGTGYTHPAPVEVRERARQTQVPSLETPVEADYGGLFRLWGYDLAQKGERLRLTLHWGSLAETSTDYKFFVHLLDPAGNIAIQHDGMPRGYTYPTSLWAPGEVVSDEAVLSLTDLEPGEYRLALGWYDEANNTRLEVVAPAGWSVSEGRLYVDTPVVIP